MAGVCVCACVPQPIETGVYGLYAVCVCVSYQSFTWLHTYVYKYIDRLDLMFPQCVCVLKYTCTCNVKLCVNSVTLWITTCTYLRIYSFSLCVL